MPPILKVGNLGKSPLAFLLVTIALGFLGGAFFPTAAIYNLDGFMDTLSRLTPRHKPKSPIFS